jgi:hypothetical protein
MNLNYKDNVFTALFNDPEKFRELYNVIKGANYDESAKISINTLSEALFLKRINDISFTVDNRLVVLLEHQSTVNHPCRRKVPLSYQRLSRIWMKELSRPLNQAPKL